MLGILHGFNNNFTVQEGHSFVLQELILGIDMLRGHWAKVFFVILSFFFLFFFFRVEEQTQSLLGKRSTTELNPKVLVGAVYASNWRCTI